MTITSSTNKAEHVGNNVSDTFNYTYRMDNDSDMGVYLNDVIQPSGYSVNRAIDNIGGDVVFDTPPPIDVIVTLLRVIPLTQEHNYVPYDAFPAEAHEDALDKQMMAIQQVQEQTDRNGQAIGAIGTNTEMPPFSAGKAIKWDDGTEQELINSTYDPDEQAVIAQAGATTATTQAGISTASATDSQLNAWVAEAEAKTADSYADEPHNILVKKYTSNGDGTFSYMDVPATYSSFHWSVEAAGAGGLPDAPDDGNPYVRASLVWAVGVTKTVFDSAVALLAPLSSPTFTGVPKAPTAADNSNPTALATTQFVIDNAGGGSFTDLDDTPANYSGKIGQVATVNSAEDGLIFSPASSVASFSDLTDTPADYAGQKGKVATVNTAEDAIEFTNNTVESQPIGSIIHFGGTTPPAGYLACQGQTVTVTQYPDLHDAIGSTWNTTGGASAPSAGNFRLPPQEIGGLGLYLRGDGTSTSVGDYQADVFKSHNHTFTKRNSGSVGGSEVLAGQGGILGTPSTDATGDLTETRPRSITTLLCIKATYSSFTGDMGNVPVNGVDTVQLVDEAVTSVKMDVNEMQVAGLLPTAWCKFNGATAGTNSPGEGYNVASVTKNGTGNYTITFATPMDTADYAVIGLSGQRQDINGDQTVTTLEFETRDNGGNLADSGRCSIVVFGGKV